MSDAEILETIFGGIPQLSSGKLVSVCLRSAGKDGMSTKDFCKIHDWAKEIWHSYHMLQKALEAKEIGITWKNGQVNFVYLSR